MLSEQENILSKRSVITWFLLLGAVELALGFAGGAEYVMRQWDAMDSVRSVERVKDEKLRNETTERLNQTAVSLSQQLFACQENFEESTVIYERPPQLTLGFSGFRGLPVIPIGGQGDEAPHWMIPAKVKPIVLGDSRGAVYYYMSRENRMDGPYLPDVVKGQ